MEVLFRSIKADFIKLRRTPIFYIHILIPLIGALIFLLYYSVSIWDTKTKLVAYFQVIAAIFPLLVGMITGIVVEQEEQAGNFQNMLSTVKSKTLTYFSKIIVLLILSILSITIATFTFGLVFKSYSFDLYFKLGCALFLGNIFIYILQLFISLKFGKGISIGLGIAGVLISALMETGLGDGIWHIVPWAWTIRFCDYIILGEINNMSFSSIFTSILGGLLTLTISTFIILIFSVLWFNRWEGRKLYD